MGNTRVNWLMTKHLKGSNSRGSVIDHFFLMVFKGINCPLSQAFTKVDSDLE